MALGRGLSELLGEVETAYDNNTTKVEHNVNDIDVKLIQPNPCQPRKVFNEEKLQELSDSISAHGLLQPIVVTRNGDEYVLIAGERRLKATKLANIDTIKATILNVEESKLRELALIENIQRDDLNIIELAYSYAGLIKEHNMTHEELSEVVSKSRSSITNTLRILTLSVFTQQMLSANKVTPGHAKVLIGLSDVQQELIVNSIVGQQLSVRETEQLVRDLKSKEISIEETSIKKNNTKTNLKPLETIIKSLDDDNLKVKTGKNYIKIELNNDEDVEKFLSFLTK